MRWKGKQKAPYFRHESLIKEIGKRVLNTQALWIRLKPQGRPFRMNSCRACRSKKRY